MNRDFLKEAIADAKAVKESAIANAKVALEEAFSPQVKAMFASKIEEMEKDEMDESYDEVDEAKKEAKVEEKMSNPVMRRGDRGDNKAEKETEYMREEEDMDLDEILAELEKDAMDENARTRAEEEGYKDGMKDEKEDLKEDERTDAEEEGYLDGEEDEKEDMEDDEDEEIDLEDMSEDDLKSFIEEVIADMVTAGELEAGEEFEVEDDVEVDVDVEDEEEVTIGENARTDAEEEGYKDGMKDEKEDLKKDLKEAMDTVATLRSELNEINLLNAKLLYTSKVFRSKNLTESQKVKVLSAFDKAETIKEAKLVFETINTSVKSKTTNNSITEGFRSKGSASNLTSTPKVTKKQPIVESDEMVHRFKKLAGII
jgi:hypothetical protein